MPTNPTLTYQSQFIAPYNILPDVIYTNPTANTTQFNAPYNILPDVIYLNPTVAYQSQFTAPYNILPDTSFVNPTANTTQFNTPLNYGGLSTFVLDPLSGFIYGTNPTLESGQFNTPLTYGGLSTFDLYSDSVFITQPNPTLNTSQFNTPLTFGEVSTFDLYPDSTFITKPNPTNPNSTNTISTTFPGTGQTISIWQFDNANGRNTYSQDAVNWTAGKPVASNISLNYLAAKATGFGASVLGGAIGVPQTAQVAQSLIGLSNNIQESTYSTLDIDQLHRLPGVLYADFRARRQLKSFTQSNTNNLINIRLDGTAAATRISKGGGQKGDSKSYISALYAAASANPLGGAYGVFNLDGFGATGYGWGSHDDPYAIRNDFTLRTNVSTDWDDTAKTWFPTKNIVERAIPFRGDRVNVIDRQKEGLIKGPNYKSAYTWKPSGILNTTLGADLTDLTSHTTQDFIKFFFTGPLLKNSSTKKDEILVFRAIITELSDRFSPTWQESQMIGRADPNYHYTGFSRDVSLNFTVYATSRDELKPIWRKLNALAGYTTPIYDANNMTLGSPWMRITIGDLFHQQPVVLSSLSYTMHDQDTIWEINIEKDPYMKQVPHKIDVQCEFHMITDFLPQKGGQFYSLSDSYDGDGLPIRGFNNWLSDFIGSTDSVKEQKAEKEVQPKNDKATFPDKNNINKQEQITTETPTKFDPISLSTIPGLILKR